MTPLKTNNSPTKNREILTMINFIFNPDASKQPSKLSLEDSIGTIKGSCTPQVIDDFAEDIDNTFENSRRDSGTSLDVARNEQE